MSGRTVARIAGVAVSATLLLAAWYFLAPSQLGGRTAYVTTVGSSMQPTLEAGDLVVVRRSSTYEVGDVVAYRNPRLEAVVLHRIVGSDGYRFVLQGDANTWTDSYRPSVDEVVGEMAVRLPGVGARLAAVRSPVGASSLAVVGAVGLLGGRGRVRGHRARRGDDPRGSNGHREEARPRRRHSTASRARTVASAVVAALGASLCVTSVVLPPTQRVTESVAYDQRASFRYEAAVPGGEGVYGTDAVGTGDPVYLRLTERVRVGFSYRFESPATAALAGTVSLVAELSDVNGWSRTFELAPPVAFDGRTVEVGGVLRLDEMGRLTRDLERATGVDRLAYSVIVAAEVELRGTLAGGEISETFDASLAFLLDDLQLQVVPGDPATSDPFEPAAGGLLEVSRTIPRTIGALGLEVGLDPLRWVGLVLLGLGAVGLLVALAGRWRAARAGEPALIQARFGRWLVPVHTNGGYAPDRLVDVESFESLVRLADHYGHMVLHDVRDDGHVYAVEEGAVTYRYRPRPTARPGRR
ncbi:MAG TPA: signal peptidase I [Actinomycetota bacterium]